MDSERLAQELYEVLRELDPSRWRAELATSMRPRIERLREQMRALLARASFHPRAPAIAAICERLTELLQLIDEALPRPDLQGGAMAQRWNDFRVRMTPAYERLASSLANLEVHVPSLRPTNYARNTFHVLNAILGMMLLWLVLTETTTVYVTVGLTTCAWTFEFSRRKVPWINNILMRAFQPFAHPHERWRVNSATWYSTALLILSLLYDLQAAAIAIAVLGFADPAAAIIGRRFGRTQLINGRTLEGTSAFIAVGTVVSFLWLSLVYHFSPDVALLLALGASVPAGLAELVSRRIDDNLSIPVAAALGMVAIRSIIGV